MRSIRSDILVAVNAYMTQYGIDPHAATNFCAMPTPDLDQLYRVLFGTMNWKEAVIAADWEQQPGFSLSAGIVLKALVGASIHAKVLSADPPEWSCARRLREALGEHGYRHFKATTHAFGYEPEIFLGVMSRKEIRDPEILETVVAKHAIDLACTLMVTLQQHLQQLPKLGLVRASPPEEEPWVEYLTSAFERAIIMRQAMDYSDSAVYRPM